MSGEGKQRKMFGGNEGQREGQARDTVDGEDTSLKFSSGPTCSLPSIFRKTVMYSERSWMLEVMAHKDLLQLLPHRHANYLADAHKFNNYTAKCLRVSDFHSHPNT